MRKRISFIILSLLLSVQTVFADTVGQRVITLGADLTATQKDAILTEFNHQDTDKVLTITKEDETHYLGSSGDGRELSSSLITMKNKGEGTKISISPNITQVNETMYRNALLTAGIADAEVSISSPSKVTGTAALTGIYKAFEAATGQKLDPNRTKIASQEVADSAKLGQQIGNPELAASFIEQLKEALKQWNPQTDDDYRKMIDSVAKQLGINLTPEQVQSLISLLKKINSLDVDWAKLGSQLQAVGQQVGEFIKQNPEKTNAFLEFCKQLITSLQNLIQKLVAS
jgi:uncharacterized protein YpuA (DUF1002 family)